MKMEVCREPNCHAAATPFLTGKGLIWRCTSGHVIAEAKHGASQ
jgi:hypothetical protein